jgi:putrescine aminotransferase
VAGLLLQDHGIISAYTLNNPNVLRLEPPLTVSDQELDRLLDALRAVLRHHRGVAGVVGDLGVKAVLRRLR